MSKGCLGVDGITITSAPQVSTNTVDIDAVD
jgi:hypothetical protein